MTPTLSTTWHVIHVVNPLYVKWNLIAAFHKGQVTAGILNFGKVDDFAVFDEHITFKNFSD
jgi:hypothetical protein